MAFPGFPFIRQAPAGAVAIAALAFAPGGALAAAPRVATLVCTNLASHVSWRIQVDLANGTVDSNPARIGGATISWHDRSDGGNYTLDRKSGDLTVIVPSSTGGYSLHDRCAVAPLKAGS
jgi:hypothetical protein